MNFMKKYKNIAWILIFVMTIGFAFLMTACSGDDEESPDEYSEDILLTVELDSDSENGNQWEFEQDKEIFRCEELFIEDEGDDEHGEMHVFEMFPIAAGTATLRFTNATTNTVYTYKCTVSEKLDDITVDDSKGESNGESVEPAEMFVERN